MTGPIYTPGLPPLQLPPSLLGDGQALPPDDTITPEAFALAQEDQKQLELENIEKRKKALKAIFGDNFPLVLDHEPTDSDWTNYCESLWVSRTPGVQRSIWQAERHRQFRAGSQYQSRTNGYGAWREPAIPKDTVRIVDNCIRPALAWQMQVVAEQRPGWSFKPTNTDADRLRKASAQQRAVEYQYDVQKMRVKIQEAIYWAQTDGASFAMTYWDPEAGPWEELEEGKGPVPLGEPCTKIYRIEQVRVSPEASATVEPMDWLVREILPLSQAVALYGPEVADALDQQLLAQQTSQFSTTNQYAYQPLFQDQKTVSRYTIFARKSPWLPQGLTAVVVGKKLVYGPVGLLMGRVPMIRFTDGSEDPAFFPTARIQLAIAPQMRVNMLWSKWYESIRKNAGGRFATKTNAVPTETFIGGETSLLEVRTSGDIRESILPIQGFVVGNDIKEALDREKDIIGDLTGYTKEARGQFSSDQSGRAILAQREQLERVFAPLVMATAEAMSEWAKQMVGWMRFGYQVPRKIAITGKDRADLATNITAADLDGIVDVSVDPETMVPQPKALRQWLLDNAYDRQLISKEQWLERSPFGDVRDMEGPAKVQFAKAKRLTEALRLRQPAEPVLWQDDEAMMQNILERDLILAGGIEDDVRQAALQRWQEYAEQSAKKRGPQPPAPESPEGKYQKFTDDIKNRTVETAEQLLSQAVEQQIGLAPPPAPTAAPVAEEPEVGKAPPKGTPQDPRTAPVGNALPSVAAGPQMGEAARSGAVQQG
jgi:hypothetical protein